MYALEKLMQEDEEYQEVGIDLLCAYVRSYATYENLALTRENEALIQEKKPREEVLAAMHSASRGLSLISKRGHSIEMNLKGVVLSNADLKNVYLQGANLQGANLQDAELGEVYRHEAILRRGDPPVLFLLTANQQSMEKKGFNLKSTQLMRTKVSKEKICEATFEYIWVGQLGQENNLNFHKELYRDLKKEVDEKKNWWRWSP